MKATMQEIENRWETHYKERIVKTFVVEGDTKDELFRNAYPHERTLRYCNGFFTKFEDAKLDEEYREWLKTNLTIELYYGNGVVD